MRAAVLWLVTAGCASFSGELRDLAVAPPLDYSVVLSGGAFAGSLPGEQENPTGRTFAPAAAGEAFALERLRDVLVAGRVFHRVAMDQDVEHRRALVSELSSESLGRETAAFLRRARDQGHDLLLAVERLQDGPIEAFGVNGRWPITLTTWFLLGVGMLIPDHTYESRATLRVTLRELQRGKVLYEQVFSGGPLDLSLVERVGFLGIALQLVVPPFWVADDPRSVAKAVREITKRRLLISVARDLKSAPLRELLRTRAMAAFDLVRREGRRFLIVHSKEGLASIRLRAGLVALRGPDVEAFQRALLDSVRLEGGEFAYEAALDLRIPAGPLQVLVSTIGGNVSSATLDLAEGR
ncbi:MAG: hypothetical protein Fur0037_16740 [Planctomycetota bacterium]